MALTRKEFFVGLGGATVGAVCGMPVGARANEVRNDRDRIEGVSIIRNGVELGYTSYAQSGEDLMMSYMFRHFDNWDVTYLDVGAHDPIKLSNTYFFYRLGYRGVLVEPNPGLAPKIKAARPDDTLLTAGIGFNNDKEADYYMLSESSWNTFSKEQAEHCVSSTSGKVKLEKVIKMPLLNINDVMAKHFSGAPTIVSIDTEGLCFDILKTMDLNKYRPKMICIETIAAGVDKTRDQIAEYLVKQNYIARCGSFVNAIYVSEEFLNSRKGE